MKQVLLMAFVLLTLQATAQNPNLEEKQPGKEKMKHYKEFTPEQLAELQTKRMTLRLDLTDAQQKKIFELHLANAKERKTKMKQLREKKEDGLKKKLSPEERFKQESARLDKKIAHKKEMKQILTIEQYEKWERSAGKRLNAMHKKKKIKEFKKRKMNAPFEEEK